MTDLIYTPVTTQFANAEFVSIRVDDMDYYIISQLPMDEDGISGFQTIQDEAQVDFERILGKDSLSSKFLTSLDSEEVFCISHKQLDKIVDHYAFYNGNSFALDLVIESFNTELRKANDVHY